MGTACVQPSRPDWPVPQVDPAACDGCGLCVRVCPHRVLAIVDGLAVVIHPERCDYTGLCERVCPRGAIQRAFEIVWPGEPGGEG